MAVYFIKNYNGKYLNINGSNLKDLTNHQNVTLWSKDSSSNEQKWKFNGPASLVKIKSLVNLEYALSRYEEAGAEYGTPGNCDVDTHYANESYTSITFIQDGGYYLIKQAYCDLYLTAAGSNNGANVSWEYRATTTSGKNNQKWLCELTADNGVYATVSYDTSDLTVGQQEFNAIYILNALTDAGFNKNAACAVLGNFEQESNFDPGVWEEMNNTYKGYGIAQWTPATKFIDYARNHGIIGNTTASEVNYLANTNPKALMDAELDYLLWSCENGHFCKPDGEDIIDHTGVTITFNEFKNSNLSIDTLTKVFHDYYEKSADTDAIIQQRVLNALKWYNKHSINV